jgi:hypothetical protein
MLSTESPRQARTSGWLIGAVVVAAFSGLSLCAAEVATRAIDGYRLWPLRLESSAAWARPEPSTQRSGSQKWERDDDALPYIGQVRVGRGVDKDWFVAPFPAPVYPPVDTALEARSKRYKDFADLQANYEWNWNFVIGAVCRGEHPDDQKLFDRLADLYVFDPADGSEMPRYRFLRSVTYPTRLHTNTFGWRGHEIALNKPAQRIRIAFVGASTTVGPHGEPFSYPELVGLWLDKWAEATHADVSFDVINAGREGVNSQSLPAIVRQELLPIEPDLVYYDYDGANEFWPADYIWTPLPSRSRVSGPKPSIFTTYSAIARRIETVVRHAVVPGVEPTKPSFIVDWPRDLNEHDPDLTYPKLPVELPRILSNLELVRTELNGQGAHLVMTSFAWLVHPGLVLDPVRDAMLFDYLNTMYWPFSYRHMRRLLDFKTRVLRKYAAVHGLDFIDIDAAYPRDPRLFDDAIHMTRGGIRLQAWIVFNGLVPIIERQLASHEWPRPARRLLSRHPALSGPRRLVPMNEVRAACTGGTAGLLRNE